MKPSRLPAVLGPLLLGGCIATYTQQPGGGFGPPQVVIATPGGFYPLDTTPEGQTSEPPLSAPPGYWSQDTAPLPSPAGTALNGTYDGTATLLQSERGYCPFHFAMTNMHVRNNQVRFANFRGPIGPDGGVRLSGGWQNWITGHFDGGHFAGFYSNRYCAYSVSLDRVGP